MGFWKGLLCIELLIYDCYMVYGVFGYALQGQYISNPSYQGLSLYSWEIFGNPFELVTGILDGCLHGNISIKVSYNVGHDIFRFPILEAVKANSLGSSSLHCTGSWRWSSRHRFHRLPASCPLSETPAPFHSRPPFLRS